MTNLGPLLGLPSLGPYAGFILISYALVACVIVALIAAVALDYRRQQARLRDLEASGAVRRSGSAAGPA